MANYYAVIPANVRYDKDLTANAKLLFGEISALTNEKGFCWASNEYFAELYNVSTRSITTWISQLAKKNYIYVKVNTSGDKYERIIRLVSRVEENFPGSNFPEGVEENFKNDGRKLPQAQEENFYKNNTLINNTNNTTINITKRKNNSELDNEFETLWRLYPKKQGKANAKKSYLAARKGNKHSYETIENGLYRYIDYLKVQGTEEKFIMHGSTWFNGQKWLDEYISIAPQKKIKNFYDYYQSEFGGDRNEFARDSQVINYDSIPLSEPNEKFGGF